MKLNWKICAVAAALVSPAGFAMQEENAQPLPPLKEVLKGVTEQGKKEGEAEQLFKQFYTYTRSKVTEYRNAEGEVKKREAKKKTYSPKTRPAVSTVTSAREESDELVTDGKVNTKAKAFDDSDFAMADEFLGRFDFKLAGRETLNGRPTLIVDFRPADKELPEKSIKDKFINKVAGRAWIDEEDFAIVKANLRLTENVNVVGGLVGAVGKFTYQLLRERTEDGLWFARDVKWHLEGRQVFLRRVIDYHEQRTDVKKAW